jgi:hypothetical protein
MAVACRINLMDNLAKVWFFPFHGIRAEVAEWVMFRLSTAVVKELSGTDALSSVCE